MRGPETEKNHLNRAFGGFYNKFMTGLGLDIGFKGSLQDAQPVLPTAIGIDTDTSGYNGKDLPLETESQDYVFNSHCLEHISDYKQAIQEWFRVLKTGGNLIIVVPHQFLYEKKAQLPSRWNGGHHRFYTGSSLLKEIEESLEPNSYRIVHLRDNDDNFDYQIPPEQHSGGSYEIECVVKKIKKPDWELG